MPEAETQAAAIEEGAYELLSQRLHAQAGTLKDKAQALNERRESVFGGTEMRVIGSARIRTENNCVPRDIVHVAGCLLFGFNVFIGLKSETQVRDVFSLHTLEEGEAGYELRALPLKGTFLDDGQFKRDFAELFSYYKQSTLTHLRVLGGKLLAVFKTGEHATDAKVFRWAVTPDGAVTYIDNRGERDNVFPSSYDFEWRVTTRDDHVLGRYPHVSIEDEIFVETVGGDLTVKVENNTEDGRGIYRELVEDANQSLADADILYARVGSLILLKVLPYRETQWRHLVYDTRAQQVTRIDAIGQACLQLPEDHGIIFPGGYYLRSGGTKTFEADIENLEIKRIIRSPNGEDVLYVFHHMEEGRMMLLSYNLIAKALQNPIHCHGYSLFDDGRMVVFRYDSDEPTRVHPMQVWQTAYYSDEYAAQRPTDTSVLGRIGNADLVRGISDTYSVCRMVEEAAPSVAVFEDLIAATTRMADAFHWLDDPEVGNILETVKTIQATAELVLGEFEKVQSLRAQAEEALAEAETRQQALISSLHPEHWETVGEFVDALAGLRTQRGHLITLRELRYADLPRIDAMEAETIERFDALSQDTVVFLLQAEALAPYHAEIENQAGAIERVEKRVDLDPIAESLDGIGNGLDLLNEVLAGLKIEDATQRTEIVERISEVYASLNRVRATLELKRKDLAGTESRAEFAAQFKLFSQSVAGALGLADTPEKTEEQLTRLLVQLEELEGRFSELDEYLGELAAKREEVYELFETRKQALMEERQRRARNLAAAAERILDGVARRSQSFKDADQLNTYFATDPMVLKLRDQAAALRELGDSVQADNLEGQIKAARDQATRALRDRLDIFEGDGEVIRLGRHRFSVNTQALDLTLLPVDGTLAVHLTGTDYLHPLDDPALAGFRDYWDQALVSETPAVYRAEYLAACLLFDAEAGVDGQSLEALHEATRSEGGLLGLVRRYAAARYDEGYERGVHDADGALILARLLDLYSHADLLRYGPVPRSLAATFWAFYPERKRVEAWDCVGRSLGQLATAFGRPDVGGRLSDELAESMSAFFDAEGVPARTEDAQGAGRYLVEELKHRPLAFTTSAAALDLAERLTSHLDQTGQRRDLEEDLGRLAGQPGRQFRLAQSWLATFSRWTGTQAEGQAEAADETLVHEAAGILVTGSRVERSTSSATTESEVTGLLGQHPRLADRRLHLRLDEILSRLGEFRSVRVPGYRAYREMRHTVIERERELMRLEEFKPEALTSFVRNRLIDDVYLPIVGDNLAKQMGALGDQKRTDLMGLLLLISPPGYGKTTLMEYIAQRLGLVFMKVNCPAIGHQTTAIDPGAAPNATARQELEKLNLGLEMGNNVMLYLDDIQHTNPEFLQKFISLADAQRKIEGVWRGRTRTYDLRGKKVCVVMAGNPYTESGEAFAIPDMLANRADIYNLGDVLGGHEATFAMSYIENALTSNPALAPLATRDMGDLYKLVRMADGDQSVAASELTHSYSATERQEILSVLQKLRRVQSVVLAVNQSYIASASQKDAYRTEPPFKLQGSYRNMNKMAEKVVAVMSPEELEQLIEDHYAGEAQTLTTGAEENLLKLAELRGTLAGAQLERWEAIKKGYRRIQSQGGGDADPVTRVVGQLSSIGAGLESLQEAIGDTSARRTDERRQELQVMAGFLSKLQTSVGDQVSAIGASIDRAAARRASESSEEARALTAFLSRLQSALEDVELNVQVVNQPVPGMQLLLTQLVTAYEQTLLPLLKSLHHKLSLDESIWRQVMETSELIKKLDRKVLDQGTTTRTRTRPMKKTSAKAPAGAERQTRKKP